MFIYTTQIFEENVENFMVYGSYAAILLRFSKKSFSNSTARFCRFVDNEYHGLNTNQFLHYSTQSCCRSTTRLLLKKSLNCGKRRHFNSFLPESISTRYRPIVPG